MNNIQFSLPEYYRAKLAEHSQGDSLGKTAKRLIMEILDGPNSGSVPSSSDLGDLGDLGDRLTKLEERVEYESDRLQELWESEPTDENVRKLKGEFFQLRQKIEDSLTLVPLDPIGTDKRLSFLENQVKFMGGNMERLYKENRELKTHKETAIMIQKQPLTATKTEITLTHAEAAKEFGKALATVKKWGKSPDQWPDGWIFDGDKQLWFKS